MKVEAISMVARWYIEESKPISIRELYAEYKARPYSRFVEAVSQGGRRTSGGVRY